MTKQIVEFEYQIGQVVKILGLDGVEGRVVSLWYSERGCKYEIVFYSNGNREVEYFFGFEIEATKENNNKTGFLKQ